MKFLKSQIGKVVLIAVVLMVVMLSIYIWHNQAKRQLNEYADEWQNNISEITALESKIMDSSGDPRELIQYKDVIQMVNLFESKKEHLATIEQKTDKGEGMSLWLPSKRAEMAESMNRKSDHLAGLVREYQKAAKVVSPLYVTVNENINAVKDVRSDAIGLFGINKEVGDFQNSVEVLKQFSNKIAILLDDVSKARDSSHLTGMAEKVRTGIIDKMQADLQQEQSLMSGRIVAATEAQRLIFEEIIRLNGMITGSTGFFFQLKWIAEQMYPTTERAYELTQPLRRMIEEADRPIFGSAGNMMGRIFSRNRVEKVSALSLACQIDPSIKYTVEALTGMCEAISLIRNEVSGIISATRPLSVAVRSYRSNRCRKNIISLANASGDAHDYFLGKTKIFNPVLSKFEEGRGQINNLYRVSQRIRIPGAQNLMSRLASTANNIISIAEGPFERAHKVIFDLVNGLNNIPTLETEYTASLQLLRADPPKISKNRNEKLSTLKAKANQHLPRVNVNKKREIRSPSTTVYESGAIIPWVFEDSDSRYLTGEDLRVLSSEELWRARNEIYAKRGYRFKTARGKAYSRRLGSKYNGFEPDAEKVYAKFNQYEKANIQLIIRYEKNQ